MPKILLSIASLFFLTLVMAQENGCYPPKPKGLVADQVDIFTPQEENALERRLQSFSNETSNQIVVVSLAELCEGDAAMTAYRIGEMWGVGQKEFDNGIVVLIKPTGGAGQRKTFIATGYGLEGAIPDATAKLIVDREMIPSFKAGDYYGGTSKALDIITDLAKGEYDYKTYSKKENPSPLIGLPFLIIVGIWLLLVYRKTNVYARNNDLGFWAALMMMNAASRKHRGSYRHFSGGSGGFGGFGGGGGFGGFGGGSFGGGGAGGSW